MAAEPDPDRPTGRQVIEPTAVFRPVLDPGGASDLPVAEWMEELHLFRPPGASLPPQARSLADEDTQEIEGSPAAADAWIPEDAPPAPPAPAVWRHPRTAVTLMAGLGAGIALSLVLMLPRDAATGVARPGAGGGASASASGGATVSVTPSAPVTSSTPVAPSAPVSQAPGGGEQQGGQGHVLTLGDTGPLVTELQTRLLRIPNVYQGGQVNGQYDQTLAEAVSRFQVWYGIRGDANGVYGDATRRDLESRT
ncbi:peptidoglycan-binding domain-containing protein [Streptomyces sp. NPDC005393]|uniref:peptidoglycan-binding domain-containing protein n=1 Tax=Streptomyces sp. NPDC005393 TaxID=3157041 RepID=UPI0033B00294